MSTYYVATTGNDLTGVGSIGNPWQHISKGVAQLVAGDILEIRGGTYTGSANALNSALTTVHAGGNFGAGAITIRAYAGETVTIRPGSGVSAIVALRSSSQQYLIFDRLILDGTGMSTLGGGLYKGTGCAHIRLTNCEITTCPGHGIETTTDSGGDLQVLTCHVHHNGSVGSAGTVNLRLADSDNLVQHTEIDHGVWGGVVVFDATSNPSDNVIWKNNVHDNAVSGGAQISVCGGGFDNEVALNLVHGTSSGYGILVDFAA